MSAQPDLSKLSVGQFAERFRSEMIPLSNTFSYFCASVPLSEEDLKEYLEEPIAALPPAISALLPKVSIMLVPYLERGEWQGEGHRSRDEFVCTEKPPESRLPGPRRCASTTKKCWSSRSKTRMFPNITTASITCWRRWRPIRGPKKRSRSILRLLREELNARVHGEVDEESWHMKQALLRRDSNIRKETKAFRDYARQSLIDTLTLYLHGICCDIDVETGPRQLPSRYLRKRLNAALQPVSAARGLRGVSRNIRSRNSRPVVSRCALPRVYELLQAVT